MFTDKIKTIFIDIDNTLLDFDEYVKQGLQSGFMRFGLGTYTPDVYHIFTEENNKLWKNIEAGTLDLEGLKQIRFNIIFSILGIDFDGVTFETYFREELNESAIPVSGALQLLSGLSHSYMLCAASNGPTYQQKHRLQLAGMDQYFSYNFISEELGAAKPSREYFDKCFNIINSDRKDSEIILPRECLMIGDSLSADILGGNEYGMHTCFYDRTPGIDKTSIYSSDSSKKPDISGSSLLEILDMLTSGNTRN